MKKRLAALLLLQLFCAYSFSGNIAKKYKSHLTEEGTVYFIMPQKMSKAENSMAHRDLLFDITCLDTNDTVSVAATIHSAVPVTDSLVVIRAAQGTTYAVPTEVIYRDLSKKGYVNRLKFNLSKREFRTLFAASQPFFLDYGKGCVFAFTKKKWAEKQQLVNSIMDLMDLNR